jgi:hypothetical protein
VRQSHRSFAAKIIFHFEAVIVHASPLESVSGCLALHHDLTVVSRNTGDFKNTPAQFLNPWEA